MTVCAQYSSVTTGNVQAPVFTYSEGKIPTSSKLLLVLQLASRVLLGSDSHVTLHSLRRGAIEACAFAGLSVDVIKEAGPWSSNAYSAYLPDTFISRVPSIYSRSLGLSLDGTAECCHKLLIYVAVYELLID